MNNFTFRTPKPFIKWVGGKSQLLAEIEKSLPNNFSTSFSTYIEPFVGGGAVVFWMLYKFPHIKKAIINDVNEKLINVYRIVKYKPKELISLLETYQNQYLPLSEDERKNLFLEKRERFNNSSILDVEQAAIFIFLNRTCFNGLYRENSKGQFNVPHGKYLRPMICDSDTIMADSNLLQKVEILCGDFSETINYASDSTLFYLDPPYKPLSETSSFNNYVKETFDDSEQIRLRDFCNAIDSLGSKFILSNSDLKGKDPKDDFFDNLYKDFRIKRVLASRMINSNPDKRGKLTELMISNILMETQHLFNYSYTTL